MRAFLPYQFISYIRSFKYIPPFTALGAWIIVFYSYSGVPVLSSYAVTSLALYMTMAWISMSIFSLEEETERHLLFVQLGRKGSYFLGKWVVCVSIAAGLGGFTIGYPIVMQSFKEAVQPFYLALSIYSHFTLALFGILLGFIFSNWPSITKRLSWLSVMLIIAVSIAAEGMIEKMDLLRWVLVVVPPVTKVIRYLADNTMQIGLSFWLDSIWVLTYLSIGSAISYYMFRKKVK